MRGTAAPVEGRAARAAARHPAPDRRAPDPLAPRGAGGHGRRGVRLHGALAGTRRALLPALPACGGRRRAEGATRSSTRLSPVTRSSSGSATTSGLPCRPRRGSSSRSCAPPTRSRSTSSEPKRRAWPRVPVRGTLPPEELRGSTFTVTSAGRLGGLFATPLVNHPEVAILGLHRIGSRAGRRGRPGRRPRDRLALLHVRPSCGRRRAGERVPPRASSSASSPPESVSAAHRVGPAKVFHRPRREGRQACTEGIRLEGRGDA